MLYISQHTIPSDKKRLRKDFLEISSKKRIALANVPEDCLTASRGFLEERTKKIPQARVILAQPKVALAVRKKKIKPFLRLDFWSYWADLNRRPAAQPRERSSRTPRSVSGVLRIIIRKQQVLYIKTTGHSLSFFWSYWADLNRRPADYESAALPTEPQ